MNLESKFHCCTRTLEKPQPFLVGCLEIPWHFRFRCCTSKLTLWEEKLIFNKFNISAFRFIKKQPVIYSGFNFQIIGKAYFCNFQSLNAPLNLPIFSKDVNVPRLLKRKAGNLDVLLFSNHRFRRFYIQRNPRFARRTVTVHFRMHRCVVLNSFHSILVGDRSDQITCRDVSPWSCKKCIASHWEAEKG